MSECDCVTVVMGVSGDAGVAVDSCIRSNSISGGSDGARVWEFRVFSFAPRVMLLPGLMADVRLCAGRCRYDIDVPFFTQVSVR